MKKIFQLAKLSVRHWMKQNPTSSGAAISYYTIFSLAPLIYLLILLAGLILGHTIVEDQVLASVGNMLGEGSQEFLGGILGSQGQGATVTAALLSGVGLILGSMGIFNELNNAVDKIWREHDAPKKVERGWKKIKSIIKEKMLVFSLVPFLALLVVVAISVNVIIKALPFPGALALVAPLVSLFFLCAFFALIYKVLSPSRLRFSTLLLGAFVTAILFLLGQQILGIFLVRAAHLSDYGASSAIVAIMLWVYYSAQMFLLGASTTYIHSRRRELLL